MDITPLIPEGRQVVDSYGKGRFRISRTVHRGSVIVFPERTVTWPVRCVEELDEASFTEVIAAEPPVDVLLLGCGQRMTRLSPELVAGLRRHGIALDAMDTGAACRTYNVLMAEGRRVAAALIALS